MVKLSKYCEDEFSEYLIETINVKPNQESMGVKRTALYFQNNAGELKLEM